MNRLILIEGIPGSGKTTMATKVKTYLESCGYPVQLFLEGDLHPVDLAWMSVIPLQKFEEIRKLPLFQGCLDGNYSLEDDHAVIAYTMLDLSHEGEEWMTYFEQHEVYDQRIPFEEFQALHFARWKRFGQEADPDTITIFECAYLQNHISELLRAHDRSEPEIIAYMQALIQTVKGLNPMLIYLTQPSVRKTIQRVADQRRSPEPEKWKDWIDQVAEYVEDSPYGKDTNAKGVDGVFQFIQERKDLEFKVMDQLDIEIAVIENFDNQWKEVEDLVMACLGV
ncbi:hypothetical protein SANA_19690 [Gottschalkiaceae bacterium SANA]|nr:hypothetical protein SANA_19690 [Gottschalkiaceae bacterium SANA]